MNVLFGVCFPFDIIGEIIAWPPKNGNYGKKLLPTRIQEWTRNSCALFVKLIVDNQNMPNICYSPGGGGTWPMFGYRSAAEGLKS